MRSQALYKLTTTNPVEPLGKINVFRLFPKTPKMQEHEVCSYTPERNEVTGALQINHNKQQNQ